MADAPECPYALGDAGGSWWAWAWGTPQASKWDDGALYTVGRRAALEDLAAALDDVEAFDLESFMSEDPVEAVKQLKSLLETLKASATGFVGLSREMRELEGQLGFGAKSMATLGWKPEEKPVGSKLDELRARREKAAAGSTAKAPLGS